MTYVCNVSEIDLTLVKNKTTSNNLTKRYILQVEKSDIAS